MARRILFFLIISGFISSLGAQDLEILRVPDFDLRGPVKSCEVVTDYGQEIFEFDAKGRLVKSVTQYGEGDKTNIYYFYKKGFLTEKRQEVYQANELDRSTSMAFFYVVDSTLNTTIYEQVISYDRSFSEQHAYVYGVDDSLERVQISHSDAVDELIIERRVSGDSLVTQHIMNGTVEREVTEFAVQGEDSVTKGEITVNYYEGKPSHSERTYHDGEGRLVARQEGDFDDSIGRTVWGPRHEFEYGPDGVLSKEYIVRRNSRGVNEYIFQFDSNEPSNWVKKIVLPDNRYTTRRISYFDASQATGPKSD